MITITIKTTLFCAAFLAFASANQPSREALATALLNAITGTDSTLFPEELIYPPNLAAIPEEQKRILKYKPGVSLFDRSDLEYRIVDFDASRLHPDAVYPFEPTHVIIITHRRWNPEVPALSVEILKREGVWWVAVPKLSRELADIFKRGIEENEMEVEELTKRVSFSDVQRFSLELYGSDKYKLIEEIADKFEVSLEASILFLSGLKSADQVNPRAKP